MAGLAAALVAGMLALPGSGPVSGQEAQDCPVEDLGTLKSGAGQRASGRGALDDRGLRLALPRRQRRPHLQVSRCRGGTPEGQPGVCRSRLPVSTCSPIQASA